MGGFVFLGSPQGPWAWSGARATRQNELPVLTQTLDFFRELPWGMFMVATL
jgi:hypothetical protein